MASQEACCQEGNCGGCRSISYCDRDCQRQHWQVHKDSCRLARTMLGLEAETVSLGNAQAIGLSTTKLVSRNHGSTLISLTCTTCRAGPCGRRLVMSHHALY